MRKEKDTEDTTQSAWNLSQHDILLIGDLSTRASYKYRSGQIQESFFDTEEIRTLIHTDLDGDEDDHLDELEKEICEVWKEYKKLFIEYDMGNLSEDNQLKMNKMAELKNKHATLVKNYRRYMRELLGKNGYLFSKKDDASRMF